MKYSQVKCDQVCPHHFVQQCYKHIVVISPSQVTVALFYGPRSRKIMHLVASAHLSVCLSVLSLLTNLTLPPSLEQIIAITSIRPQFVCLSGDICG